MLRSTFPAPAIFVLLLVPGASADAIPIPHELIDEVQAESQEAMVTIREHVDDARCAILEACDGEGSGLQDLCDQEGLECPDPDALVAQAEDLVHATIDDIQDKSHVA